MQDLLLIGLSRQVALRRELDVVANNVANIDTTGYKANGALFEEYLSSATNGNQGPPISFVRDRATYIDMSRGPVQHTGNPLDLAIDGEAFFAVQTPNGVRYTRNGAFKIDATGQIVTNDGNPVLGDGGPIKLQPNDSQLQVSPDGTVSVREGSSNADSQRGKLRLVRFANINQLQKEGASLFNYLGANQPPQDTKSSVIQGSLEKSNVKGVLEMARMIEITRSYQQISAMMQQQNDMGTTAINKLGEVPA
jgi:flagellar basal-body rod protein FlgF